MGSPFLVLSMAIGALHTQKNIFNHYICLILNINLKKYYRNEYESW